MSLKVPNVTEVEVLTALLNSTHTLRIYGNDKTPADGDTAAAYTEIAGGGYVASTLPSASWTITAGTPSVASFATQTWIFTGAINAPGTIYGYYITRNSDSRLLLAERFPSAVVPFVPINGSKIVILPRLSAESQF